MKNSFKKELKKNRIAEVILLQVLESIYDDNALIEDVADNPDCYHLGDVMVTNRVGNTYYFDAKNDGCIHKTGNVFCESHKHFLRNMKTRHSGFMEDGNYDYLSIVDRVSKCIYILDFKVLKKIYKNYRKVQTVLEDAYCYGNVISLEECKKKGALLHTINYEEENGSYYAINMTFEQKCKTMLVC